MSPKVNISPESLKEKLESLLKTMTEGTIAAGDLDKYYEVEAALNLADGDSMVTMDKVFGRLVGSIQNRSMMPNVIKYWKHPQVFDKVLCGHSPQKVLDAYGDAGELYDIIRRNWPKEEKPLETEMKGLWKQWCEGVLSAARFLNGFNNVEELRKGFGSIYDNVWARPALPALLAMEISGIQFALACDFLKECGYDYPKPDVHLTDVFEPICNTRDTFVIYRTITEYASKLNMKAYKFDKMIWLVCSGNFYLDYVDEQKKKTLSVTGRKDCLVQFISNNHK